MTPRDEAAASEPARRRAVRVALFAAVGGPLIGAAVYLALLLASSALQLGEASLRESAVAVGNIALLVVVFAYAIGGLPALAAGVWLAWRTARRGGVGYGEAALAGALSALLLPLWMRLTGETSGFVGQWLLVGPVAIVAALIGRYLLGRLGWVGPPAPPRLDAARE